MQRSTTHSRLKSFRSTLNYVSPGSISKANTIRPDAKPARITKRQLEPVLGLLRRVAAGGDARTAVDAASCIPMLERAALVLPPGQPRHRKRYRVTLPSGEEAVITGVAAVARAIGKAKSTVANALSKGNGFASFPATDGDGNPAAVAVERMA